MIRIPMRTFIRQYSVVLRKNAPALLLFETAFRIAFYLLALEIVRRAAEISLKAAGYSNLTAANFLDFLLRPVTAVLFLGAGIFLVFLLTLETAALLVCFQYSAEGKKVYLNDLFFVGIRQAWRLIRRRPAAWLFFMSLSVPFLQLQFLVREASYVKLFQYSLQVIYEWIPHEKLLIAGIFLLLAVSYLISFGLPFLFLEEQKGRESLRRGLQICRRRPASHIWGALGIQAMVFAVAGALYLAAMMGAVGWALEERTPGGVISSLLVYSQWVDMGIGLAAGSFGAVFCIAFFFVLFRLDRGEAFSKQLGKRREIRLPGLYRLGRRKAAAVVMALVFLGEMTYVAYLAGNSREIFPEVLTGVQITAHRGGAKFAPENTLAALAYSREQNADYAEIDVQETRDGVLVLLHDNSLKRTAGLSKDIWELDYYQVQKLEVGSRFRPEFAGEEIPTLREAIRFAGTDMNLIIEIKYNGHNREIVSKVLLAVEDLEMEERVILCSSHYPFLQEIKQKKPEIATSYVMPVAYGDMSILEAADCLSVKHTYLNSRFVQRAHQAGKAVHAWTVNARWGMERMQRYQVDNLITDSPAAARQVLQGEGSSSLEFWELLKYVL